MNRTKRIQKLQGNLEFPLLVTHLPDIFYLSGFTGSTGFLLIFPRDPVIFLCDGRYTTQAREELTVQAQVLEFQGKVGAKISEILRDYGENQLLIDERVSVTLWQSLRTLGINPIPLPSPVKALRVQKDGEEITKMKQALTISEQAFRRIMPLIRPGTRERDIAIELEHEIRLLGAEIAFPTIVAGGKRTALPHASPSLRVLQKGEWVLIDWGARFEGYCVDLTRVIYLGTPNRRFQEMFRRVQKAQNIAKDHLRAGVKACQIDELVRKFFSQENIDAYFTHGLGHGVGIEIHEDPALNAQSETVLEEGMIVTVEPGVYFSEWGGIRLESMVLITQDGCLTLDQIPIE